MKINPCLSCEMKDCSKNNPICYDCKKRIAYLEDLNQSLNYATSYGGDPGISLSHSKIMKSLH
jgi:hypothetical protein